jgi:hypothetical protein
MTLGNSLIGRSYNSCRSNTLSAISLDSWLRLSACLQLQTCLFNILCQNSTKCSLFKESIGTRYWTKTFIYLKQIISVALDKCPIEIYCAISYNISKPDLQLIHYWEGSVLNIVFVYSGRYMSLGEPKLNFWNGRKFQFGGSTMWKDIILLFISYWYSANIYLLE